MSIAFKANFIFYFEKKKMNPFSRIWIVISEIVYHPIFNLLIIYLLLFQWNLWLSIIFLTLTIRLILLKPTLAWNKVQKQMTDIQPKMQEIQTKYKDNPQKQSEEMMKLMKTEWAWPLKWCLMMMIQLPIFIWLFYVISDISTIKTIEGDKLATHMIQLNESMYSFINYFVWSIDFSAINHMFLWIDLFKKWNWVLAILSAVLMYIQIKLTMMNKPASPQIPQQIWGQKMPDMSWFMEWMNVFMIFMIFTFVLSMPAWIWVYIVVSTLFWVVQFIVQYKILLETKLKVFLSKNKKQSK